MESKFSLKIDHRDSRTHIITCPEKQLHIKVYPNVAPSVTEIDNILAITAIFYPRDLQNNPVFEQRKDITFHVVNCQSPSACTWSKELFLDAIEWYCDTQLKKQHDGINYPVSLSASTFDDVDVEFDEVGFVADTGHDHIDI